MHSELEHKPDHWRHSSMNSVTQRKANNTGLPDNLKSGMEALSGMSLNHVNVHYDSPKPLAVQAHAYAQGSDIYLASGQEKHLPHELGHVVQQMQGRVQPTTSVGGIAVNDNPGLEKEADVLGAKALQMSPFENISYGGMSGNEPGAATSQLIAHETMPSSYSSMNSNTGNGSKDMLNYSAFPNKSVQRTLVLQKKTDITYETQSLSYKDEFGKIQTGTVGKKMTAILDPDDKRQGSEPGSGNEYGIYRSLRYYWDDFIKGHMLNAHLGGLGVPENLFPITTSANSRHKELEYTPKFMLANQIREKANHKPYHKVSYDVDATSLSTKTNFDDDPKGKFSCTVALIDGSTGLPQFDTVRNWEIHSDLHGDYKGVADYLKTEGWGDSGSGQRWGVGKENAVNIYNDPNFTNWYKVGISGGYVEGTKVLATLK